MRADNFLAITMKLKAVFLGWKWCSMKSKLQNPKSCTFLKAYVTPSILLFLNGNDKERMYSAVPFIFIFLLRQLPVSNFLLVRTISAHYYNNS